MMTRTRSVLVLSVVLIAAACGQAATDDQPGAPDAGIVDPGTDVNLSGTWASRVINSQMFDGLLGEDNVILTNTSLMTLDQSGTALVTETEVCSVSLTPYKGNQTRYPPAAITAISRVTASAALGAPETGASYTNVPSVRLIGWVGSGEPSTEALPDEADDPRVVDADGDGNPGITLNVEGGISGDIYIVNRTTVALDGIIMSSERIQGSSHTEQAQNIIGASNPTLTLAKIEATPDPDESASTFVMVRVESSDTCASILAAGDTLFD